MTNEQRIAKLEKQVREFRVVTAGPGDVQGGFGPLPKGNESGERLDNLEKAASEFFLTGDGVNVAGSFDEGYFVT